MEITAIPKNDQSNTFSGIYGVKLEVFEGPLDLLLFLIRKNEVDIYDIPIAVITNEYLSILSEVQLLDLEPACDFMLMAATLMKIKSQLLLPREITDEGAEEDLDPRADLVRRLLEYQQFKEIAEWLGDQAYHQRDVFRNRPSVETDTDGAELHPVSLFDLLKAYKHAIDHIPRSVVHRIVEEQVSVEESIELLLQELEIRGRLRFFDMISGKSRHSLVASFIAILELLKSQRISVQQARPFDDIWIEPKTDSINENQPLGKNSTFDIISMELGTNPQDGDNNTPTSPHNFSPPEGMESS